MGWGTILKFGLPILLLLAAAAYVRGLQNSRDGWKDTAHAITAEIQKVGGFKGPLKPKKDGVKAVQRLGAVLPVIAEVSGKPVDATTAPKIVREIGAARDKYLRQSNERWQALLDQTRKVLELAAETRRQRDLSAQQKALARQLIAQRNDALQRAERAATRTQRLSDLEEARQCEQAMDALYEAGF